MALAVCAALCPGTGQADDRPNIILVTVDTFRPDHIGYDGYRRDTSPYLDSLSAEGVYFRRAFTTSGWTSPGLVSILTSLYAPAHGVDIRGRTLDPSVTTLAQALRAAGYRAPDIFFLSDIPNFQNLGFEPYARRSQYVSDGDEILFRWLEEEAGASDQPFFLYHHYRDLHQPYAPGPEYEELFAADAFGHAYNPLSWVRRFLAREKVDLVQREVVLPRGIIDFAPWDKAWVSALYDGQIRRLDDQLFARLRRVLRERALAERTIVVVSADHGEELLEHGVIGHVSTFKEGRLSDEIIRIPLILWAPGRLPAGRVVDDLVQCIDIMPTLLDAVGAPIPDGVQGRSLMPLLAGQSLPPRPVFLETSTGGFTATLEQYAQRTRAVRTQRWKLVWHTPGDAVELYDLAADPGEQEEVAASHPAQVDSLRALLETWVRTHPRARGPAQPPASPAPVAAAPVEVRYPADGDALQYAGAEQTIRLHWTGPPAGAYVIEYEVGEGVYHLEGSLEVSSSDPSYGPFHADFWNSLVLYNPWRFRVYPLGQPQAASPWVSFRLDPAGDGSPSLAGAFAGLAAATAHTGRELAALGLGLGLGLADLGVWVAGLPAADVTAWALLAAIAGALVWPPLRRVGEARVHAWGAVLAYVALVYATVPVFPAVWARLREHTGTAIGHLGTVAVLALLTAIGVRAWRRMPAAGRSLRAVALFGLLGLYAWMLAVFSQYPAERLHLIEYGGMGFLLLRALRLDAGAPAAYGLAIALTAVIGFGDETIQWVLPQRYFELKDVGLNVVAGALGLAVVRVAGLPDRPPAPT